MAALAALTLALTVTGCDSGEDEDDIDLDALEDRFECDVRSIGATASGSLTASDCTYDDGFDVVAIDYYAFRVTTAGDYTLLMRAASDAGFDSYLHLYTEAGSLIDEDDDDGGGIGDYDALIERTLQPGVYVIGARGYDEDEFGDYTLSVTRD